MSRPFDENGKFVPSERVQALKPWPIMGYNMPRTMRGVVVTRIKELKLFGFVITISRRRWEEKKVEGL